MRKVVSLHRMVAESCAAFDIDESNSRSPFK